MADEAGPSAITDAGVEDRLRAHVGKKEIVAIVEMGLAFVAGLNKQNREAGKEMVLVFIPRGYHGYCPNVMFKSYEEKAKSAGCWLPV